MNGWDEITIEGQLWYVFVMGDWVFQIKSLREGEKKVYRVYQVLRNILGEVVFMIPKGGGWRETLSECQHAAFKIASLNE